MTQDSTPTLKEVPVAVKPAPLEIPTKGSTYVDNAVERVTAQIKLDTMISNMSITGDLLHLAYNSVPTKNEKIGAVRGDLSNMQASYKRLCIDCGSQMSKLSRTSEAILRHFSTFYMQLTLLKEKTAIAYLKRCGDEAQNLAHGMGDLKIRFEKLEAEAKTINLQAHTAQGEEETHLEEVQDEIASDKLNREAAKDREKRHRELHKTLQQEYHELSAELKTEQERAFALQMTSAIVGGLSQAVGAGAAIYMQTQTGGMDKILNKAIAKTGDGGDTASNEPESKEKCEFITAKGALEQGQSKAADLRTEIESLEGALEKAQKIVGKRKDEIGDLKDKITEKETAIEKLQEEINKLGKKGSDKKSKEEKGNDDDTLKAKKKELKKLKGKLEELGEELEGCKDNKSDTLDKVENLKDQIEEKKGTREELENEIQQLQQKFDLAKVAFESIGGALSGLANSTGQMSDKAYSNLASIRETKKEMFKLMLEQREAEMQAQSDAKKYLSRLKRMRGKKVTVEATIRSIEQLIAVIKSIIRILGDAQTFWQNLADACQSIADSDLMADIQIKIDSGDYTDAQRLEVYGSDEFRDDILFYCADWVALKVVADTFSDKTQALGARVDAQFGLSLKGEEREQLVKDLSDELSDVLNLNEERNQRETELLNALIYEAGAEEDAAA